jgi:hypothetical protein
VQARRSQNRVVAEREHSSRSRQSVSGSGDVDIRFRGQECAEGGRSDGARRAPLSKGKDGAVLLRAMWLVGPAWPLRWLLLVAAWLLLGRCLAAAPDRV